MNMKKTFIIGLIVLGTLLSAGFILSKPDATFSQSPRQTGEEILEELVLKSNQFTIRVGSNGCTDKNSFRVDIKKEDGISKKTPHYQFTVYRIRPDECKAIVYEGVLLTYDLKKDFGISGPYTYGVANRVYAKHGD